jgi:ubiquinone/menaquinone biosynthesis C-methylase UbiE
VFAERQSQLRKLVDVQATTREILQHCQITYLAPVAESKTGIPDESVDIVYSSTVLEHVPLAELAVLMGEARRVLRPGGFMFHLINPADHFTYSDRSISTINFLQFSESEFAKYNSDFMFQNRLRPFQYRQFILEHGFEIVYWKVLTQPSTLEQLPRKYLHKDFAALADEELSAHDIYVVARRLQ